MAEGTVIQHCVDREFFEGLERSGVRIPSIESEIELMEKFGQPVLGIGLISDKRDMDVMMAEKKRLRALYDFPIVISDTATDTDVMSFLAPLGIAPTRTS